MTRFRTHIALIAIVSIIACNKPAADRSNAVSPGSSGNNALQGWQPSSAARYSGGDYSQPIAIDTANRMIRSYVTGMGYPAQDTALRSLSFDADTLRAYLNDPKIVTLKFYIAHQQAYMNTAGGYGKNAGMKPGAITLVIAGLDNSEHIVRNSSNGVYEHTRPCPNNCNDERDAYLY